MPLNFQLRREKHAIGEFSAVVQFFHPVSPMLFVEIGQAVKALATDLELLAPVAVQNFFINGGGVSMAPQNSVGFQRFSPVTGEAVRVLQCTEDRIGVTIRDYESWDEVQPLLMQIFGSLAPIYLGEVPAIKTIQVQYLNEFRANTADITGFSELFASGSPWIPVIANRAPDYWHCHYGTFVPFSQDGRYLINVNVDNIPAQFPETAGVVSYSKVFILSAMSFDIPDRPPLFVDRDDVKDTIAFYFDVVHSKEKEVLAEVVAPEYLSLMGVKHEANQ